MRRGAIAAFGVALLVAACGCGRRDGDVKESEGGGGRGPAPQIDVPADLEFEYSLVRKLNPEVGQLRGIALGRVGGAGGAGDAERLYAVGSAGVAVLDTNGAKLARWKTPETARAVTVAGDGTLYVALAAKVVVYDAAGKVLREWGTTGAGPGEFKLITSLALSGGSLYVADAGNKCVHRYAIDGDFIATFGKRDKASGEDGFLIPSPHFDVAIDGEGRLHVANPGNQRVELRDANGELLSHWGKPGFDFDRFSPCCNPADIALMPDGKTVTSEKGVPRVKVYGTGGEVLAYIGPEHFPENAAGLDLAVGSAGRIYVVEPVSSQVFVFERKD